MNKDHAIAGAAVVSVQPELADVLAGLFHQTPALANSEAALVIVAIGAIAAVVSRWLQSRKPAA